jgi:hypothetical protein
MSASNLGVPGLARLWCLLQVKRGDKTSAAAQFRLDSVVMKSR